MRPTMVWESLPRTIFVGEVKPVYRTYNVRGGFVLVYAGLVVLKKWETNREGAEKMGDLTPAPGLEKVVCWPRHGQTYTSRWRICVSCF